MYSSNELNRRVLVMDNYQEQKRNSWTQETLLVLGSEKTPNGQMTNGTKDSDFVTVLSVEQTKISNMDLNGGHFVTVLQVNEKSVESEFITDVVTVYRLPGERLGMALKFEGGDVNTSQPVTKVLIQSIHPDSPAARAKSNIGSLKEMDQILDIDGKSVKNLTRLDCVSLLRDAPVRISLKICRQIEGPVVSNSFETSPSKSKKGSPPPIPPRKTVATRSLEENGSEVREKISRLENGQPSSMPSSLVEKPLRRPSHPPPLPPRKPRSNSETALEPEEPNIPPPDQPPSFPGGSLSLRLPGWDELLQKRAERFLEVQSRGQNLPVVQPAQPGLYVDLFAEEDKIGLESESDDTGSSVSTVLEKFSRGSTANSSFSEHGAASNFDLKQVLSPFERLERELDEAETQLVTILPPESFQDVRRDDNVSPVSPPGDSGFMEDDTEDEETLSPNIELGDIKSASDSNKLIECRSTSSLEMNPNDPRSILSLEKCINDPNSLPSLDQPPPIPPRLPKSPNSPDLPPILPPKSPDRKEFPKAAKIIPIKNKNKNSEKHSKHTVKKSSSLELQKKPRSLMLIDGSKSLDQPAPPSRHLPMKRARSLSLEDAKTLSRNQDTSPLSSLPSKIPRPIFQTSPIERSHSFNDRTNEVFSRKTLINKIETNQTDVKNEVEKNRTNSSRFGFGERSDARRVVPKGSTSKGGPSKECKHVKEPNKCSKEQKREIGEGRNDVTTSKQRKVMIETKSDLRSIDSMTQFEKIEVSEKDTSIEEVTSDLECKTEVILSEKPEENSIEERRDESVVEQERSPSEMSNEPELDSCSFTNEENIPEKRIDSVDELSDASLSFDQEDSIFEDFEAIFNDSQRERKVIGEGITLTLLEPDDPFLGEENLLDDVIKSETETVQFRVEVEMSERNEDNKEKFFDSDDKKFAWNVSRWPLQDVPEESEPEEEESIQPEVQTEVQKDSMETRSDSVTLVVETNPLTEPILIEEPKECTPINRVQVIGEIRKVPIPEEIFVDLSDEDVLLVTEMDKRDDKSDDTRSEEDISPPPTRPPPDGHEFPPTYSESFENKNYSYPQEFKMNRMEDSNRLINQKNGIEDSNRLNNQKNGRWNNEEYTPKTSPNRYLSRRENEKSPSVKDRIALFNKPDQIVKQVMKEPGEAPVKGVTRKPDLIPVEKQDNPTIPTTVPPLPKRRESVPYVSSYPQTQLTNHRYGKSYEDLRRSSLSGGYISLLEPMKRPNKFKGLVIPDKPVLSAVENPLPTIVSHSNNEKKLSGSLILSPLPWKGLASYEHQQHPPTFQTRSLETSLSPPPSSPSSVCSSTTSSFGKTSNFQFSLSHSKPVTPTLPETPIIVTPSYVLNPTTEIVYSEKTIILNPVLDMQAPPLPSTKPPVIKPYKMSALERLESLVGIGQKSDVTESQNDVAITETQIPKSPYVEQSITREEMNLMLSSQGLMSSPLTSISADRRSSSRPLSESEDDDANSLASLRTEDSRQTADDSMSDATTDSLGHNQEFKPRRISQQRTVLRARIDPTDSVKSFRALAERWETRAVEDPPNRSPPCGPSSLNSTLTRKDSGRSTSSSVNEGSAKLPPSLQPRCLDEKEKTRESRSASLSIGFKDNTSLLLLERTKRFSNSERSVSSFALDQLGKESFAKTRMGKSYRSVSVSDIRKTFENQNELSPEESPPLRLPERTPLPIPVKETLLVPPKEVRHGRFSSMDSTASDSGVSTPAHYGSSSSLATPSLQFGSVTSLASTSSLISSQDLHQLIEDANQSLSEESPGLIGHEIAVVVLHKDTLSGSIGITLAGGADYEIKEITVHRIISSSLADRDGRLRKGDRIISINGRNLRGVTHREALDILKAPRQEIVLVTSREKGKADETTNRPTSSVKIEANSLNEDVIKNEDSKTMATLLELVKDGASLGFSLEGGKDSPMGDKPLVVKRVFKGGAADRDGRLAVGNVLFSVNQQSVLSMTRTEAWNYMKKLPDGPVTLTILKT